MGKPWGWASHRHGAAIGHEIELPDPDFAALLLRILFRQSDVRQLRVGVDDVLAGARFRAPLWMRSAGLEWLFRLLQEPRRLFPRYVINNSKFCLLMANATMVRWMGWRTTN